MHLLTATGAVLSMLALLAAANAEWSSMFLWLVIALIVDGVDGPLARRYQVKKNWPTYDGVLMDLIIDYLTYVFIPAYALFMSGLLPGWTGWIAIIAITYGSVIYFADTRMKTRDYSFAGFPACWNMVVLVLFALKPSFWVILLIVVALTVTMFTNVKFIHPVRTRRWRAISLPVCAAWVVFALALLISTRNRLCALGPAFDLALAALRGLCPATDRKARLSRALLAKGLP
ncbi:CDP-alcohol phosphatidyltransferase family protein [Paracoccus mutanolyticus]|uniref:CDP-alcohol phosphatidyltransferase family protein n=1 Tax=Paracoccus mutanolyticus TaxID=1499308 RepID=UPI001CB8A7E5|nr:CDP-alcohol phosphatidyltransferase family protein [Paracoccus mutanolyticus]